MSDSSSAPTKKMLGDRGEAAAAKFLKRRGYRILERNFRTPYGEIDIIAQDQDTVCFVEVKTRTSDAFGQPEEAILKTKKRRLARTGMFYLNERGLEDAAARFDVVAVQKNSAGKLSFELFSNAFEFDEDLAGF